MPDFDQELHRINSKINRWHATEHLIVALSFLLIAWVALTALDVWLRPQTYGRLSLSLTLIVLVIASLVWLIRVANRKPETSELLTPLPTPPIEGKTE